MNMNTHTDKTSDMLNNNCIYTGETMVWVLVGDLRWLDSLRCLCQRWRQRAVCVDQVYAC